MIRIRNPHHVPFLHQTDQLREAGTLCDTLLTVDGRSFKAHALILALASKRLQRLLTKQHNSTPGYRYAIENVSPRTFKQILDYVYSESVEVPEDDLEELLKGAQYLEVESLVEQCQAQLRRPESPIKQKKSSHRDDKLYEGGHLSKKRYSLDEDHLEEESSNKEHESCSPQLLTSSRETAVATPAPSPSPRLCWPSVNPSRGMVFNYRELMTFHSLHTSQHMFTYPYPTPVYPFLHHSLHSQVPSSVMGFTGLLHPYHNLIHSPSSQDSQFIQGLRGKNASINAVLTGSMPEDQERKPMVQEEREMCCRYCGKTALENPWRSMSGSTASAGSGELTFRCKFCGRGGRDNRSLRPHKGLGGEKPYPCKHCSKRFSLKHQLDTHHRVHTGEKPFECRLCGQRSRDYSAMIKHLRTHGGATPYQCTMCLEYCSSLAAMQKHLKNHATQDFPPDWNLNSTYLYNCHI